MELSFKTGKNSQVTQKQQITEIGLYSPDKGIQEEFKGEVIQKEVKFPKDLGEEHPFEYHEVVGLYKKYGMITGVVDKYVDFIIGNGMYVKSEDERAKKIIDDFMDDVEFPTLLRSWVREAIIKGVGYLELGGNKNEAINGLKVLNSNHIYIKRDDKGEVKGFNQYLGNCAMFMKNKVISFEDYEIADFHINKVSDDAYGQGIIAPALKTINALIGLEKDMHTLMHRKANVPIHAKIGSIDQPVSPEGIKTFGKELETLNNKHEWATDHLVEFKTLDFGKIGEKFDAAIKHDLDMLFFTFQVPEVLMGRGNIPEGLAVVQMEAWQKRCASIQEELEKVIEQKIFKRVLLNNKLQVKVEIVWGQPSESDKNAKILRLTELLKLFTLSPEMKFQLELQLAREMGIDDNLIKPMPIQKKEEGEQKNPQVPGQNRQSSHILTKEEAATVGKEIMDSYKTNHIHSESCNHVEENMDDWNDKSLKEWLDFNYLDYIAFIVQAVNEDEFSLLRAVDKAQEKLGYLTLKQTDNLREVMKEGFMNNKSLIEISNDIEAKVKPKNLYNTDGTLIKSASERPMLIARTETVRLAAQGSLKNYSANGIKQYAIVASLGKRTCSICEGYNGKIYEIGKGPIPSFHVNCRCSVSPVVVPN